MTDIAAIAASLSSYARGALQEMDGADPPIIRLSVELELGLQSLLSYESESEFYLNQLGQKVRTYLMDQSHAPEA